MINYLQRERKTFLINLSSDGILNFSHVRTLYHRFDDEEEFEAIAKSVGENIIVGICLISTFFHLPLRWLRNEQ